MSIIRTFVATPVIELESLREWVLDLKKQPFSGKIKWSNPQFWHLTFKFIGNTETSQLYSLGDSLSQALDGCQPGNINIQGAGYFGSSKAPNVIWAGLRNNEWLVDVKRRIDKGVSSPDLPEERRSFQPHLTLARVKYLKDSKPLVEAIRKKEDCEWGNFEVNRIVLYKSQLMSDGPVYSELKSFELK